MGNENEATSGNENCHISEEPSHDNQYKPEVKRYDCTSGGSQHCYGCYTMEETELGDYVEWEAYEALQAECERLRKDAERYRWLQEGCDQKASEATRIATNLYGLEWDAAIDAAMERHWIE